MASASLHFLCISTYFKGEEFLKACKEKGNRVFLLTLKKLEHEAWPFDHIDEVFYIDEWVDEHVENGLAYSFRSTRFDRIVALDDFDVEKAARLRELFRIPGMGQTTMRYFRDKLAMRIMAQDSGIKVPSFSALFHDPSINAFADKVAAPWLVKPRYEASAHGIKKVHSKEELWEVIHALGDERHHFLVEKFAPGDVYHVDGLNYGAKVIFARASRYLDTPFEVAHGGGIFRSMTIDQKSKTAKTLLKTNKAVMKAFGMEHGASHTEFICSHETGEVFFLETSSRVGGANLAEMVEYASGINLWAEWARIEHAMSHSVDYELPPVEENRHAGIVVSLSRYEHPDTADFADKEIVWRMQKPWHIGLIVSSESTDQVKSLLDRYTETIASAYHASLPPPEKSEGM